jgi:ATP-dependent Clp protease adaptor protein ClpS
MNQTRKKKPPIYRVLLHNDNFNKREYVVQVLLKVVPDYTVDQAIKVMNVGTFPDPLQLPP